MLAIAMGLNQIQRNPFFSLHHVSTFHHQQLSCSKLLSGFFKSGRVSDAEQLFDKLPHRDVIVWSIAIHGYAVNGFHEKSIKLFSQMRESGKAPNSFTVVGILVGAERARDLMLAKSVHGLIVKSGLKSDVIVGTSLLDTYAKCGQVSESYKVFREMKKPNVVTCGAIVTGFINSGVYESGFRLFGKFRRDGILLSEATVLTLCKGCAALQRRVLCECLHGLIVKLPLVTCPSVNNSILHMYSSLKDFSAANKVFEGMESKDLISWTTLMGLLVDLEHGVIEIFSKMREEGVRADAVVFIHLTSACSILGDLKRGKQIHGHAVVSGFQSMVPLMNSIVSMYTKCGDLDSSKRVFDQITRKSIESWTAMISGYAQNGCPREALDFVIKAILEENYSLDSVLLVSALSASGELAALDLCLQLHCYSMKAGFSNHKSVQNNLISVYSKCGRVELAKNIFKEMDYLRDVVSWNAILNGYGVNGFGEAALSTYHDMREHGENPDSVTYVCILSACSHAGLVSDGLKIFKKMLEDDQIRPNQEHYGCIIDLLMRAGCLSDERGFADKFLEETGPDVWKALLSGCSIHGNVELAELAAKNLFEKDLAEMGHVVPLSNLYKSLGRFQDAEALRLRMQDKGLIKNPGISFIDGVSHDCG